ncbi:hypothetical protein MMUR_32960 [Mycolicibacterium murale]|uniref:Uncharacterized protein n=1 Tax=Mycolicibacterium murale TaxID=182220 RepID=A0A7I9WP85_9MYCO|nr:hypothetical protein MMUR_32960 [Mycolicibacterium murale]
MCPERQGVIRPDEATLPVESELEQQPPNIRAVHLAVDLSGVFKDGFQQFGGPADGVHHILPEFNEGCLVVLNEPVASALEMQVHG